MKRIFLIEDDRKIAKNLILLLRSEDFTVSHAETKNDALAILNSNKFDLALIDISLPDGNGFTLCTEIKEKLNIPVIFLTASGDEASVVTGLNMGADDYITKPFEMEELIARVNSILRRFKGVINLPNIKINTKTHEVQKEGVKVSLTPKEYDLLIYLTSNAGNILTREQILASVWECVLEDTRTVDLHLARLRKKLGLESVIKTLPKVGYLFEV